MPRVRTSAQPRIGNLRLDAAQYRIIDAIAYETSLVPSLAWITIAAQVVPSSRWKHPSWFLPSDMDGFCRDSDAQVTIKPCG